MVRAIICECVECEEAKCVWFLNLQRTIELD